MREAGFEDKIPSGGPFHVLLDIEWYDSSDSVGSHRSLAGFQSSE